MSYLEKMFSLKDKVAVVTGTARGNGKAISEALLSAGAYVFMVDVLEEEMDKTLKEFKEKGFAEKEYWQAHICDLMDDKQFDDICIKIEDLGKVDILVNNAGITRGNYLLDYDIEDWQATLKINLEVPFKLSQLVGGMMREQMGGSIINITSLNAEQGFSNNPAYVASKGALRQLTKALAMDLGNFRVRVNNVGPGYFITNMTKKSFENEESRRERANRTMLNRWGQPEDLAGIIIYLASDCSSYITGQDIYVDGGWLAKGV